MLRKIAVALAAVLLLALAAPAHAEQVRMSANLDAVSEVPSVENPGTATATVLFDKDTRHGQLGRLLERPLRRSHGRPFPRSRQQEQQGAACRSISAATASSARSAAPPSSPTSRPASCWTVSGTSTSTPPPIRTARSAARSCGSPEGTKDEPAGDRCLQPQ